MPTNTFFNKREPKTTKDVFAEMDRLRALAKRAVRKFNKPHLPLPETVKEESLSSDNESENQANTINRRS